MSKRANSQPCSYVQKQALALYAVLVKLHMKVGTCKSGLKLLKKPGFENPVKGGDVALFKAYTGMMISLYRGYTVFYNSFWWRTVESMRPLRTAGGSLRWSRPGGSVMKRLVNKIT